MGKTVVDWLILQLKEHAAITDFHVDVEKDFYREGILDSFGIIELIEEIEQEFGIVFDDSDFQSDRFRTIQGLSDIIRDRIEDGSIAGKRTGWDHPRSTEPRSGIGTPPDAE